MKHKVITWGTGNVGKHAVHAVLNHPQLELVGHIVSTKEKAGKDVAELVGLDQNSGIIATDDIDAALALRPDAVCYTAHAETRMIEAAEDQAKCLRLGINVVSSSIFMLQYPDNPQVTFLADPLKQACAAGQATCFNNGIDPGFANDTLPLTITGLCEHWRSIRVQEIINYSTYDQAHTVREMMGFGYPVDHPVHLFEPGVLSMVWSGCLYAMADALGVELEKVYDLHERLPLEEDTENIMGVFKKGTTGAMRLEVRGVVDGHDALILEHVTRLTDEIAPHWPQGKGYRVTIEGEPRMVVSMDMEDKHGDHGAGGVIQTATCIVNAIPAVVAHPPGMVAAFDLPKITGRGLYRP